MAKKYCGKSISAIYNSTIVGCDYFNAGGDRDGCGSPRCDKYRIDLEFESVPIEGPPEFQYQNIRCKKCIKEERGIGGIKD